MPTNMNNKRALRAVLLAILCMSAALCASAQRLTRRAQTGARVQIVCAEKVYGDVLAQIGGDAVKYLAFWDSRTRTRIYSRRMPVLRGALLMRNSLCTTARVMTRGCLNCSPRPGRRGARRLKLRNWRVKKRAIIRISGCCQTRCPRWRAPRMRFWRALILFEAANTTRVLQIFLLR